MQIMGKKPQGLWKKQNLGCNTQKLYQRTLKKDRNLKKMTE